MPLTLPDEYLELNSIPLVWWINIEDLSPLWDAFEVRGDDRILPGTSGVHPYRRRPTVTRVAVDFTVFGDRDRNGGRVYGLANIRAQLWNHREYLLDNFATQPTSNPGTRPAILHAPGAATAEADVHILPPFHLAGLGPLAFTGTLVLSIPDGVFAETGS